jgi:hypothetical protein
MKNRKLILIFVLLVLLVGCRREPIHNDSKYPEEKIMENITELWSQKNENLYIFLKENRGEIKQLDRKTEILPDLYEAFPYIKETATGGYTTYEIQKDDLGRAILIYVSPFSMSSDKYLAYTYYFDGNGRIRAIDIVDNNYNWQSQTIDNNELAYRNFLLFFDENGKLIKETIQSNVTDIQGKKGAYLKYKDKIYNTVTDLVEKEQINNIMQSIQ